MCVIETNTSTSLFIHTLKITLHSFSLYDLFCLCSVRLLLFLFPLCFWPLCCFDSVSRVLDQTEISEEVFFSLWTLSFYVTITNVSASKSCQFFKTFNRMLWKTSHTQTKSLSLSRNCSITTLYFVFIVLVFVTFWTALLKKHFWKRIFFRNASGQRAISIKKKECLRFIVATDKSEEPFNVNVYARLWSSQLERITIHIITRNKIVVNDSFMRSLHAAAVYLCMFVSICICMGLRWLKVHERRLYLNRVYWNHKLATLNRFKYTCHLNVKLKTYAFCGQYFYGVWIL